VWGTLSLYALVNAAEDPSARFGQVLDTAQAVAFVEADPVYNVRPLTVECWALLRDARHYNILIANEVKASATHWEFFSLPGSGCLAAYLPGNKPDFVGSSAPIADGKWHYIAMLLDDQTVRLSVDAQEVASVRITRPADLKGIPGPMFFGSLVSRDLSCDGLIAEVRVSRVVREIQEVPSVALPADEHTVGLWRFAQADQGRYPDLSPTGRPAAVTPAIRTMDRVDVTKLTPAEAAELDKATRTFSGRSHALPPPPVDLAATRTSLRQALGEGPTTQGCPYKASLVNADQTRDGVLADWEEQFFHLDRQLKGLEPLPKGAAEQVLDKQALVYTSDRDPLGVILRRTKALLEALRIADCGLPGLWTPDSGFRNPQFAIRNSQSEKGFHGPGVRLPPG
jgi:hypothetical protein